MLTIVNEGWLSYPDLVVRLRNFGSRNLASRQEKKKVVWVRPGQGGETAENVGWGSFWWRHKFGRTLRGTRSLLGVRSHKTQGSERFWTTPKPAYSWVQTCNGGEAKFRLEKSGYAHHGTRPLCSLQSCSSADQATQEPCEALQGMFYRYLRGRGAPHDYLVPVVPPRGKGRNWSIRW